VLQDVPEAEGLPESQGDSGEPLQGPESVQRRAFPAHDKYKYTFAPPGSMLPREDANVV